MDAHVPQRQGVVRLTQAAPWRRWPVLLLAIAWFVLLAVLPWWLGWPLLLALVAAQITPMPWLQQYGSVISSALRCGFAGLLIASYRAFGGHTQGLTYTLLVALAGCSLLVLLESWRRHKPLRDATLAAQSPEWRELAMAPIGPAATIIEIQPPVWLTPEEAVKSAGFDLHAMQVRVRRRSLAARIIRDDPSICLSGTQQWAAWRMPGARGIVLYDRSGGKALRLRGWQLFGWLGDEAWLSRTQDRPPLALSQVLRQHPFDP